MSKLNRVEYTLKVSVYGEEHILKIDGKEYKEVWKRNSCEYPTPIENALSDNNLSDEFISLFGELRLDSSRASEIIAKMEEELSCSVLSEKEQIIEYRQAVQENCLNPIRKNGMSGIVLQKYEDSQFVDPETDRSNSPILVEQYK